MNLPIAPMASCGVGNSGVPLCGGAAGAVSGGAVMTAGGSEGGLACCASTGPVQSAAAKATVIGNLDMADRDRCPILSCEVAEMRSGAQIPHREVEHDDERRRDAGEQSEPLLDEIADRLAIALQQPRKDREAD